MVESSLVAECLSQTLQPNASQLTLPLCRMPQPDLAEECLTAQPCLQPNASVGQKNASQLNLALHPNDSQLNLALRPNASQLNLALQPKGLATHVLASHVCERRRLVLTPVLCIAPFYSTLQHGIVIYLLVWHSSRHVG